MQSHGGRSHDASAFLMIVAGFVTGQDVTWEKLADPPKDVAGRESPPGTDGAWVYVPEWKGFLLYGGSSPSYSNEGWFFDPGEEGMDAPVAARRAGPGGTGQALAPCCCRAISSGRATGRARRGCTVSSTIRTRSSWCSSEAIRRRTIRGTGAGTPG